MSASLRQLPRSRPSAGRNGPGGGLEPSRPRRRRLARAAVAAACAVCAVALGAAPADDPYGQTVTEVRIQGNESIAESRIRAKLLTRPGRPLDPDVVDRDFRALKNTQWFSHVRATYLDDPDRGGIILIYKVEEMPVIEAVEYRGRSAISEKKLEESTGLNAGARADTIRTRAAVAQIRRLYEEKGYLQAEVRLLEGGDPGDRRVVFEIFEGPKFAVGGVDFEGNTVFSDATLRTKIHTKPPILGLIGGRYEAEGPEEDARRIVEAYQAIGYFECQCTPVVRHGDRVGDLRLSFVISEGPQYTVRQITFDGHELLSEDELRDGLVLHSGQPFRDNLRQRDLMTLTERYTAIGCIDIDIAPEPRFTDTPGVVDLVYHINEGERYLLGKINIKGNERTKAKVVLRELAAAGLLPGEPLDGRRLETAKKRLANLNYFITDPQQGDPIQLRITNRRGPDMPYGEIALPELDDIVRQAGLPGFDAGAGAGGMPPEDPDVSPASADGPLQTTRFQAPDDFEPPVPELPPLPPAGEPLAPGDGPASVVPFGSGGAFDPAPGDLPPIEVPPIDSPAPFPGVGVVPAPPPGDGTPRGTFPTLPGTNFSDVGPDRQEPYANRSLADIATQAEPRGGGRSFADLDVEVQEAPTGRILLGIGATSFGGLSGNFILHERNFDLFNVPRSFRELLNGQAFRGAGQELRIELSPGTLINRAVVSFREPDLFNRRIGLNASGYTFSRFYPDFNEARGGGRFALGKQFGTQTYADLAVRVEDVNISGFRTPAPAEFYAVSGSTFLTTLRPSIHFDNRNDPFLPSEGSYLEFAYEQGWGDFTFPKFTVEGRQHFTIWQRPDLTGKHILSMRGFFGVSGRDTPLYERFYAGDFRSLRGFAYRGVGPFILGSNVGGIMTLLGSLEYQFPLTANDQFQAVVFTDTGTVENDYSISNYRVAVGTGLRVTLPALGPLPLAFDIAFPIVKGPDDRERVFTFFIGAFY
ncbi:BamA/OMP85 family outer membrane protein [Tautonia sociabilis]|uniref:Outer membrane protein assembly factor n=1 Tax=Tautonia sociabilis TaxID=2080755 RepID=A0A432MMK1_9BACT|nr:POTRA domain-containing protein [Tautonia sociabilis]RUL88520.1 outer membrane protein assembly factor [Tautonia sociabilis]